MQKAIRTICFIIGTALFINGVCLLIFANWNLGVLLTALIGILLLTYAAFCNKAEKILGSKLFNVVKKIIALALCIEALFVSFVAIYGCNDNVDYTEDAVIVLGAGIRGDQVTMPLKYRLDKAVEYHGKNPDAMLVVTGGQGFQETVTEASAMEKYLLSCGIPEDRIIKEEKATSTNENMKFSKEILDRHFSDDYKIAVITNNFHIYRGVSIAKLEGFENVTHMHSGLTWYNLIPCYLRETLAIVKMWVFG